MKCLAPALTLALALSPAAALAQSRIDFVSRTDGTAEFTTAAPIGSRECSTGRWTFRLVVEGEHTTVPELWLSRTDRCLRGTGDTECFRLAGVTATRDATDCTAATCWRFTVNSSLLVDPAAMRCDARDTGNTRVFAWVDGVGVASPRVPWDTLAPVAPTTVGAVFGSESEVRVSWSYPTADSSDAGVDVADADVADADVLDASADVMEAGADASGDVTRQSTGETVRRFWVLCDPIPGDPSPDAGTTCPSGGFESLDISSDESLRRYASNCGLSADTRVTATDVTLTQLPLGQRFRFAVVAEDLAGNRSDRTVATECTSAETYTDFWERYRRVGGHAVADGCNATPGAVSLRAWWLALACLAVLRRRR